MREQSISTKSSGVATNWLVESSRPSRQGYFSAENGPGKQITGVCGVHHFRPRGASGCQFFGEWIDLRWSGAMALLRCFGVELARGSWFGVAARCVPARCGDVLRWHALIRCERGGPRRNGGGGIRSEEHTSELQSHSFISYAAFLLKK